jgi:hypothetical protein
MSLMLKPLMKRIECSWALSIAKSGFKKMPGCNEYHTQSHLKFIVYLWVTHVQKQGLKNDYFSGFSFAWISIFLDGLLETQQVTKESPLAVFRCQGCGSQERKRESLDIPLLFHIYCTPEDTHLR